MKTIQCLILAFWAVQGSLALVLPEEFSNNVTFPRLGAGDPAMDTWIDMLLDNLRQFIIDNNLDPCKLPDLETHVFKGQGFTPEMVEKMNARMKASYPDCEDVGNIVPETEHEHSKAVAEAKLYNGYFKGMSKINREGSTSFEEEGDHFLLKAGLRADNLEAHYDAEASFLFITVHAKATAKIAYFKISFEGTGAPGDKLELTKFHIDSIGHISIDFDGLGPLDWILEAVVGFVDTFLKGWIADLVEGPLKNLIQGLLDSIGNLPGGL